MSNKLSENLGKWGGILTILIILGAASFASYIYFNMAVASKRVLVTDSVDARTGSVFGSMLKPLVFDPRLLSIPKINLTNASIVRVGVEKDGRLEVPKSYDLAGWYGNGPKAGENGNAIIAAHYDRPGGDPAIFYNLVKLKIGDFIYIKDELGKTWEFEVYSMSYVSVNDDASVLKAYEQTKNPILTLITCGGVWDAKTSDYSKRLLVKAKFIKSI